MTARFGLIVLITAIVALVAWNILNPDDGRIRPRPSPVAVDSLTVEILVDRSRLCPDHDRPTEAVGRKCRRLEMTPSSRK